MVWVEVVDDVWKQIRVCDVTVCLTGIPPVLRRYLNSNQLSGTIPNSISSLKNLGGLYVIVVVMVVKIVYAVVVMVLGPRLWRHCY